MTSHVNHLCNTLRFHLKSISQIRKFIDQNTCHHAVRSLVLSRLDYCNGLLTSVPATHLKRLQSIQNWGCTHYLSSRSSHDQFLSLNPFTGYPFVREFDSRLFYSCSKHSSVNRQITLKTVFTFISHLDTISVPILIPSA